MLIKHGKQVAVDMRPHRELLQDLVVGVEAKYIPLEVRVVIVVLHQ